MLVYQRVSEYIHFLLELHPQVWWDVQKRNLKSVAFFLKKKTFLKWRKGNDWIMLNGANNQN